MFHRVNVAGLNLQPEPTALPVQGMGAGESGPRISGSAGLNMFLSTLSSAVEKISSTQHVEAATPELGGGAAWMPQLVSTESPLIQKAVYQPATSKESTKHRDQALRNGQPSESSASATRSMLPVLPVEALQLPRGQSWLTPNSSGRQASPTQSGASAVQPAGDLSTAPWADVQNIAMRAAGPVAFRLQLITNSELPVKETSTPIGQASAPPKLSNQQDPTQSAAPRSDLTLNANAEPASGSSETASPEKTASGAGYGDPSQSVSPAASPMAPRATLDLALQTALPVAVLSSSSVAVPVLNTPVSSALESSKTGPSAATSNDFERDLWPGTLGSRALDVVQSPVVSSSGAIQPSPNVTWSEPSAAGTAVDAGRAPASMPSASAAAPRVLRSSAGTRISPNATYNFNSRALGVQDLTTSEIVSFPGQDNANAASIASKPAATTPVSGTPAASAEPEAGSTSGPAGSPLGPLSESDTQLGQRSANERRSSSQDGRRSIDSESKAATGENASRRPQAVNGSEDSEARRKDPGEPADRVASQPAPRQTELGPAFRQTAETALQTTATSAQPSVGDARSDVAEIPVEPPKAIDSQPAIDGVATTATARQISLKLAGAGDTNVAVQLRERAGKIEVAVRSGDSQLTKSLQSGLGDLVTRLENQGFKTQAWVPAAGRVAAAAPSSWESALGQQHSGHSSPGSGNQHRQGDHNQRRQPRSAASFEENMTDEETRMKQK